MIGAGSAAFYDDLGIARQIADALEAAFSQRLYGKAGSGAATPGASGVRAVLSNMATIV